jgi:dolichol-phosphate mannosyltransferase
VLRAIDLPTVRSHGYAFQVELTYRTVCAGFDVVEVPILFRDRRRGESKMSWRIALEAAWLVPAIRESARGAVRQGGSAQARAAARRSDA